jgi:hypothetical protein
MVIVCCQADERVVLVPRDDQRAPQEDAHGALPLLGDPRVEGFLQRGELAAALLVDVRGGGGVHLRPRRRVGRSRGW